MNKYGSSTYPILLLVHEWPSPYAGSEVCAGLVGVLAFVADWAVKRVIIEVEFVALAVPSVLERRWDLIIIFTDIFSLNLVYVDIYFRLCTEKAETGDVSFGLAALGMSYFAFLGVLIASVADLLVLLFRR